MYVLSIQQEENEDAGEAGLLRFCPLLIECTNSYKS